MPFHYRTIWCVVGLQSPEAPTLSYSSLRWVMGYPVNSGPRGVSGNRTTHLRFFRPTRTDRLRYHPILNCRKCTNRTSPKCSKHPMDTITLYSRIKFSRLDSNQRTFCVSDKRSKPTELRENVSTPAGTRTPNNSFGESDDTISPLTHFFPICQRTKKKPRTL